MKIIVIGGTGMIGSRVVAEALARGHQVTAASRFGRSDGLPDDPAVNAVALDASDSSAVAEVAAGNEAVIGAISPPRDGSDPVAPLVGTYRNVADGLRAAGVRRLIAVGGAGSLKTESGQDRVDADDFPAAYRAEAQAQRELLRFFRSQGGDLDWTYVSPADQIAPGTRTGAYRLGGDQLLRAADGSSFISAEDYAVALVDELERSSAIRRRISVAY